MNKYLKILLGISLVSGLFALSPSRFIMVLDGPLYAYQRFAWLFEGMYISTLIAIIIISRLILLVAPYHKIDGRIKLISSIVIASFVPIAIITSKVDSFIFRQLFVGLIGISIIVFIVSLISHLKKQAKTHNSSDGNSWNISKMIGSNSFQLGMIFGPHIITVEVIERGFFLQPPLESFIIKFLPILTVHITFMCVGGVILYVTYLLIEKL